MTLMLRLKSVHSLLEGVTADFKNMRLEAQDGDSKAMFDAFIDKAGWMMSGLDERIKEIKNGELQNKGGL